MTGLHAAISVFAQSELPMATLDALRHSLATVNTRFVFGQFGDSKGMAKVAEKLEHDFGNGRPPDPELVLKTLRAFVQTGSFNGYRDIKRACYGLLVPIKNGKTLVQNSERMGSLLTIVDHFESDAKKLKRCFQGLLSAYLELDGYEPASTLHPQWRILRDRLVKWLPTLQSVSPVPDWLDATIEHRNLLGEQPTKRYGAAILNGNSGEFESACTRLGIGRYSWVRRRAIISSVEAAVNESDAGFRRYLDKIISVLLDNPGVRAEGAAKLLNRYAQQVTTSEFGPLRAFAVETFGNPLITANKQRWFEVSPEAREMVSNWLKGFLIERFFELLSHDGRTDRRRPEFWNRHRGSIENMWFILGTSAMSNWNDDFKKLRATMGDHCLSLQGATAGNNAFVMKLGGVYVVEFGERGNATYIFDQNALPFDLTGRSHLHLARLKASSRIEWLRHMDGREVWEDKFEDTLRRYGVYADEAMPQSQPRRTISNTREALNEAYTPAEIRHGVKRLCNERGLRYDDRAPSGRIVVYADKSNAVVSQRLSQWGFRYNAEHRRWVWSP